MSPAQRGQRAAFDVIGLTIRLGIVFGPFPGQAAKIAGRQIPWVVAVAPQLEAS